MASSDPKLSELILKSFENVDIAICERKATINFALKAGMTLEQIAKVVNVAPSTIMRMGKR